MKFPSKHQGVIYVSKEEDILKIHEIIQKIDDYEYNYIPKNLVKVFKGTIEYEYIGKFDDIDIDYIIEKAWKLGIYCFYSIEPVDYPHIDR